MRIEALEIRFSLGLNYCMKTSHEEFQIFFVIIWPIRLSTKQLHGKMINKTRNVIRFNVFELNGSKVIQPKGPGYFFH